MFELRDVRYIEGAPFDWRRVLTPGVAVVLHFEETGIRIVADDGRFGLQWTEVNALSARGPELPEQRFLSDGQWAVTALCGIVGALIRTARPYESYSWLGTGLVAGGEIIFEVEQLLRPELEALLEAHSG